MLSWLVAVAPVAVCKGKGEGGEGSSSVTWLYKNEALIYQRSMRVVDVFRQRVELVMLCYAVLFKQFSYNLCFSFLFQVVDMLHVGCHAFGTGTRVGIWNDRSLVLENFTGLVLGDIVCSNILILLFYKIYANVLIFNLLCWIC